MIKLQSKRNEQVWQRLATQYWKTMQKNIEVNGGKMSDVQRNLKKKANNEQNYVPYKKTHLYHNDR